MRILCRALLALVFSGCAAGRANRLLPDEPGEYRLGGEDVVEVVVFRDPDLTRVVPVRPDGKISLPLIGEVAAAGKTAEELSRDVAERLHPWITDPRVSVIVREVNSARFYVVGEVARPGSYTLRGRVTVLQALALAGGLSEFADRGGIQVLRKAGGGARILAPFRALVAGKGGAGEEEADPDFPLFPGDTVYVP